VNAIFRHDYPLGVEPASTPRPQVQKKKKTWRDSPSIDMLLSAVSILVVAQSSSEIPEELMNNPVYHGLVLFKNQNINYLNYNSFHNIMVFAAIGHHLSVKLYATMASLFHQHTETLVCLTVVILLHSVS